MKKKTGTPPPKTAPGARKTAPRTRKKPFRVDVQAIEARLAAIKPGGLDDEWRAELYEKNEPVSPDGWIVFGGDDSLEASICQVYGGEQDPEAVSKFIAAARQDIPNLIAEVRTLRARMKEHRAQRPGAPKGRRAPK